MRQGLIRAALAMMVLAAPSVHAADVRPVVVTMESDRFEVRGEGNTLTALRRAPVAYASLPDLFKVIGGPAPVPAAVRLVRGTPPQLIDYVLCVTEDGMLVVGQQVRTLDAAGRYAFTEGAIKRAYPALEAIAPWTWIVDIPLGREVSLSLEVRAMANGWPVRAVLISPSVSK